MLIRERHWKGQRGKQKVNTMLPSSATTTLFGEQAVFCAVPIADKKGKSIRKYFFDCDQLIDSRSTAKGQLVQICRLDFSQ